MQNNKTARSDTAMNRAGGLVIMVLMGLAGLATAGLILYQIARALLGAVFGIELPNLFR
jgi:hypothetical protein